MYDAAFQDATDNALRVDIPTPKSGLGVFSGMWRAGGALPAAGLESLRAVNKVIGSAPANQFALSEAEQTDYSRGAGTESQRTVDQALRTSIDRFTPDPAATGMAGEMLFGFSKVVGKAVGYGMAGGLPGAAIGTGLDEGLNEMARLQDEGVATGTAAKVGAVKAVSTGIQIALPMSAATKLGTAGLALVGGPGGFMAEAAASRYILEHADYKEIARKYDPFDPVGLAASTLMAGTFGAAGHVIRGRKAQAEISLKADQEATSTAAAPWFEITPDLQAAARVHQMAEHVQDTGLYRPGDLAGARLHIEALESTRAAIDAGERVEVSGVMLEVARLQPALDAYAQEAGRVRAVEALRAELIAETSGRAERGVVAEIDAALPNLTRTLADLDASFKDRAKQAQVDGLSRKQAETQARKEIADAKIELEGRIGWLTNQLEANRSAAKAEQYLAAMESGDIPEHLQARIDERIAQVREGVAPTPMASAIARMYPIEQVHGVLKAEGLEATPEHVAAVDLIAQARALDAVAVDALPDTMPAADYLAHMKGIIDDHATSTDTSGQAPRQANEAGAGETRTAESRQTDSGSQAGAGEQSTRAAGEVDGITTAARQAADIAPDVKVPNPETGELVSARQLLDDAQAIYKQHVVDSRAYEAAVTCFMRH